MSSNSVLARKGERVVDSARPNFVEHRLSRFQKHYQPAVGSLALRHPRLADLALSFPALLFALAAPARRRDPERAIAQVIAGATLKALAAAAHISLWLRGLPPEAFVKPFDTTPGGDLFPRQIANFVLRSPKRASVWLQTVVDVADWGCESIAAWAAHELVRDPKAIKLWHMRLVSLWAWSSNCEGSLARQLATKRRTPERSSSAA